MAWFTKILVVTFISAFASISGEKHETFHAAVKSNNIDEVDEMLRNKQDPDVCDSLGETALHIALENKNEAIALTLIQYGANVNASRGVKGKERRSEETRPLHLAVREQLQLTVELLLKHKANVFALDKDNMSALQIAVTTGNVSIASMLLEEMRAREQEPEAAPSQPRSASRSPVALALERGDASMLKLLIEYSFEPETVYVDGNSAWHIAVKSGSVEVCKILLERGFNVEAKNAEDFTGLILAVQSRNKEMVQYLLQEAKAQVDDRTHNYSPLHYAVCLSGNADVASVLLKCGAEINRVSDLNFTALHRAAFVGTGDMVEFLLMKGALTHLETKSYKTPLESALDQLRRGAGFALIEGGVKMVEDQRLVKVFWKKEQQVHKFGEGLGSFDEYYLAMLGPVDCPSNLKELTAAYRKKGAFALYRALKEVYVKKPKESVSALEDRYFLIADPYSAKLAEKTYMVTLPVDLANDVFMEVGYYAYWKGIRLAWNFAVATNELNVSLDDEDVINIRNELFEEEFGF